jgi:lambda family phage portal protein
MLNWLSRLFRPKALYEAADPRGPNGPHRSWRDGRDGDATVAMAGERLRRQARHLDQNHDISRGAIDKLCQFVVGPNGIAIEPLPKDMDGKIHRGFADALLELWNDWAEWPEVTWEHDWVSTQLLIARSLFRDGEVLVQLISGDMPSLDHGTRVPLSLELIEADQLPLDFNDPSRGITQGVERNAWGRPRAYHVYKTHPGAPFGFGGTVGFSGDLKRIPSENLLHLKLTDRIKQARGVTQLASVIRRLTEIKNYEDSERIAAEIAANMTAYIKKTIPELMPDSYSYESDSKPRAFDFVPGMVFDDLRPGEDVGLIDNKRPNPQVEAFRKGQLRAASGGFRVGYSSLAHDYDGSYSSQRQELIEQQSLYEILSAAVIGQLVRPVWQRFVGDAILSKAVKVPSNVNPLTTNRAAFQAPAMPWIDPLKEVQATAEAINNRLLSPQQAIRARRGHPDEVLQQLSDWYQQLADLKIPAGSSNPPSQGDPNVPVVSNSRRR